MNIEDLNNQPNNQPTNQPNNQMPTNPNINGATPPVAPSQPVAPPPMPNQNIPLEPTPTPQMNQAPQMPSQPTINLQPEGMVPPVDNTPQPSAPEPLMGATLTPNSTLINDGFNSNQNSQMNAGVTPPPMDTNQNTNNPFVQTPQNPFMNSMGVGVPTPPPMQNNGNEGKKEKKKKDKKISTPLLILLIIALIAGVGYGIFYFLNSSKKPSAPMVTLRLVTWELGEELPTNIEDYATITNIDPSSCTIDTSNLDIENVSTQKYSISCPGLSSPIEGTLEMKDTKGPVVQTKDLIVSPNTPIQIEEFIASCKDLSLDDDQCDISLKEGQTSLEDLVKTVGSYEVSLVIRDNYNNATEVIANLKVDNAAPESTLSCEGKSENEQLKATITTMYSYGITAENSLYNAKKITTFKFTTDEDFATAKETYEQEGSLNNMKGTAKFEEAAKAIIITSEIPKEDLKNEFSVEQFPDSLGQIVEFHEEMRKDTCSLS